jgi:hypothetical protein
MSEGMRRVKPSAALREEVAMTSARIAIER